MKAIIIDDEPKARNVLRILLEENCPEIQEIMEAEDLMTGVALIKQERPSLVFLDIEMPEHSGLEIVNYVDKDSFHFEIIFTTAYSEYAMKAFQLAAIDYILKPVRPTQVKQAVNRAIKFIGKSNINRKLEALEKGLKGFGFDKIALPVTDGIRFVRIDQLVVLEADGMYTHISLLSGETLTLSKPLKHFASLLEEASSFYKPHRSYLINLNHIRKYVKSDGGYILMDTDQTVSIAKDRKEELLSLILNL